jgi:hypothetical protein
MTDRFYEEGRMESDSYTATADRQAFKAQSAYKQR